MKRITLLTIVAFCGAALAANIPRSVIHGKTDEERRAEVFSAFVALSDTRGAEALPFLSDLAALTGETRRMQQKRLDRVAPGVFDLLAEASGLPPEAYREALRAGRVPDPFDHSGRVIARPDFDPHGRDGPWFWGVWAPESRPDSPPDSQPEKAAGGTGPQTCGIWLVIWDEAQWFYAPMGTEELNRIALAATPDPLAVPFARLPGCAPDA